MHILTPPATPGVTPKPWGIPAIAAGLAIPLLLWGGSLAVAIAEGTPSDLSDGEIVTSLILTILILDGIFVAMPALFCLGSYKLGWAGLGFHSFDGGKFWMAVIAASAAWFAVIVYGAILEFVFDAAPEQDIQELFNSRAVLPVVGFAVLIAAPFAEELFFRGFVFSGLLRPLGLAGALLVSGLLFAMFHVSGPESAGLVIPFTPIGMLFAWLYYKTGTIWTSITAHFVFNSVSFILLASTSSIAL